MTIYDFLVADASGAANLRLLLDASEIREGDILRIRGVQPVLRPNLVVHVSTVGGAVERIGDFCMVFSETPNFSSAQQKK